MRSRLGSRSLSYGQHADIKPCPCTLTLTVSPVAGKFVREYIDATVPEMAFGEVGIGLACMLPAPSTMCTHADALGQTPFSCWR